MGIAAIRSIRIIDIDDRTGVHAVGSIDTIWRHVCNFAPFIPIRNINPIDSISDALINRSIASVISVMRIDSIFIAIVRIRIMPIDAAIRTGGDSSVWIDTICDSPYRSRTASSGS